MTQAGRGSPDRSQAIAIEAVDLDRLALPRGEGAAGPLEIILVSAHGSAGATGHGELAATPGRLALAHAMCASVVGRDPFHLTSIRADWRERFERQAPDELRAVSGAIETALADLQGRHLGTPLFALLGGRWLDRLPLAHRLSAQAGPPAGMARRSSEWRSPGFGTLIVDSAGCSDQDLGCLRALRRQCGPETRLRLDLAGRASLARAQFLLTRGDDLWPEMIVDPADSFAGLARLREDAGVPVAAARLVHDARDLAEAVRASALDVWIADPVDLGGPAAFVQAAAVCRAFGIDIALDARHRTEVGAALALHLAAAHRMVNRALEFATELARGMGLLTDGFRIENGQCAVPDSPGLGVDPDARTIRAASVEQVRVTGEARS